ncbi:hypothetical protein BKG91_08980 [Rodentibacter caecimuris]|uniref:Uncharacterized protein n=1 Tax=Rodentibacter caecimuris TaxID=1796644 RepID=A0A9X8W0G8_9PAST|nr:MULTISPECIES: DUF4198 domain-containing protein [Pasteurellaceae]AOF54496.1 ABC-type Co2+ transport system, periplasmic component [Pasteurellaceae bacterium NI1060]MCQ9122728.1 DUF4198 domain-containing protein [Rodentibacter heylii]MCX2960355.1 DUF4198 domain-containing protein [Rodentibacter heylii]OOF72583.1 hypothetical protein BKG90_03760 [Rodentibacter heylii]OOF73674.1 hypothetical protein BKG91_08980 [Rodentibacter heylii]
MKKNLILGLALFVGSVQAHEVWVSAPQQLKAEDILKAELAYGDYPYVEKIPEARLHIFAPMEIINQDGEHQTLIQKGENYQYQSEKPLKTGSYWVTATYKPTFWSQNAEGWRMDNIQGTPNATYCEQTQMFGKSLVTVGNQPLNAEMALTRVGLPLEIVPLKDPSKVKSGEAFPVQIFYNDMPLAGETVIATADTVIVKDLEAATSHREPQGFSGKTDNQGRINILPLIDGIWKIKVVHKTPFADQNICQQSANYSTLILPVGKGLDKLPTKPEHHH